MDFLFKDYIESNARYILSTKATILRFS